MTTWTRRSRRLGEEILVKREDLQPVFSFKLRGAHNRIAHLAPEERPRGVITASAGNHAQGVAYSARHLGLAAVIVMPKTTPSSSRARARSGKRSSGSPTGGWTSSSSRSAAGGCSPGGPATSRR